MDAAACLNKLRYVGVLSFATVGLDGTPQVRCVSAIHYEPDALYFFTARGKDFCRELLRDGNVQILAYTKYKEMIRVSAAAVPVSENLQEEYIQRIFEEQPYLANVYPGDTPKIGIVFAVRDMAIEYFHLGVRPILRESFAVGQGKIKPKGYRITDACVGCGICADSCPRAASNPANRSKFHRRIAFTAELALKAAR